MQSREEQISGYTFQEVFTGKYGSLMKYTLGLICKPDEEHIQIYVEPG